MDTLYPLDKCRRLSYIINKRPTCIDSVYMREYTKHSMATWLIGLHTISNCTMVRYLLSFVCKTRSFFVRLFNVDFTRLDVEQVNFLSKHFLSNRYVKRLEFCSCKLPENNRAFEILRTSSKLVLYERPIVSISTNAVYNGDKITTTRVDDVACIVIGTNDPEELATIGEYTLVLAMQALTIPKVRTLHVDLVWVRDQVTFKFIDFMNAVQTHVHLKILSIALIGGYSIDYGYQFLRNLADCNNLDYCGIYDKTTLNHWFITERRNPPLVTLRDPFLKK